MTTDQTPRTKRAYDMHHPAFIVCALVVVVALACAVYFALLRPGTDEAPRAQAQTSACGALPASTATGLQGTPDADWRAVADIAVPTHPDHGPAEMSGGLLSCYAASPEGAVFAAANIVAMGSTGQTHTMLTDYAVEGPARSAMLAEAPVDEEASSGGVEFVGFNLRDYTPEAATVEVAFGVDGAAPYGVYAINLVREDDDWKLKIPTSQELAYTQVSTLDGYTEMRAQ